MGSVLSIFGLFVLLNKYPHNLKNLICISVYCLTLFILYTSSTLYHSLKPGKAKAIFRKTDHCSIFLLIAGTYTPLCVLCLKSKLALYVLTGVWIAAIVGIILNSIDVNKFSKISLTCYILMGWSVVFIAKTVIHDLSMSQLWFLLGGGLFYSIGSIIYVIGKKVKYMHSIWHFFVLGGSILHFMIFC